MSSSGCPECGAKITLISQRDAAELLGISRGEVPYRLKNDIFFPKPAFRKAYFVFFHRRDIEEYRELRDMPFHSQEFRNKRSKKKASKRK